MSTIRVKDWQIDTMLISALLVTNPVFWLFDKSISMPLPDSISYLALADLIIEKGLLYLPKWGHVDVGVILPPVYPILVAVGRLIFEDGLISAEFVSSVCAIVFVVIAYMYTSKITSRIYSFLALLVVQLNYYYIYYGMSILTESSFILVLSIGYLFVQRAVLNNSFCRASDFLFCFFGGGISALVMLTRQIGICFLISIFIFLLISCFGRKYSKIFQLKFILSFMFFSLGVLMFVLPYSVKLYEQTGCSLLVTHFRIGDYVVEKVNPGFLSDGGGFGESYEHIYKNRRAERMLNSAGTEMVGYEVDSGAGMHNVLSAAFARMFLAPGELLNSFWSNIKLLVDVVGWPLFMLFFVSFLSSFFVRVNEKVDRLRSFSVIFLLVYMLSVTFLAGGLVGRYIEVVFPFVVIFVVVEFYVFLHYLKKDSSFNIYFIFFSFLLLLSIPKYSFFVTYDQKNTEKGMPHRFCSPLVTYNSPVFTVSSFDSYFLGAWYRALPNDSLGRVAQYADRTGVDWLLLISDSPQYNYQYSLYTNSPWLRNIKNLQDYYPDIVRLRCSVNDQLWLYEFL